jgi:hypothetical protein
VQDVAATKNKNKQGKSEPFHHSLQTKAQCTVNALMRLTPRTSNTTEIALRF